MSKRNIEVVNEWINSFKIHFDKYENLIMVVGLILAYMIGMILGKIL